MGVDSDTGREGLELLGRKKPRLGKWAERVHAPLALEVGMVTITTVTVNLCFQQTDVKPRGNVSPLFLKEAYRKGKRDMLPLVGSSHSKHLCRGASHFSTKIRHVAFVW